MRILIVLARSMPLLIALAVLAVVIYLVVAAVRSKARAKEVLIKAFTIICSTIAGAFALIAIYALIDSNMAVVELACVCAAIGLIGLAITLACRHFFRKRNPHYQWEPAPKKQATTKNEADSAPRDAFSVIVKILNFINDNRRR